MSMLRSHLSTITIVALAGMLAACGGGAGVAPADITFHAVTSPAVAVSGDFQVQTDHALATLKAPIDIHAMNGSLKAHAWLKYLFGTKNWWATILKWSGTSKEFEYFHALKWTYPSSP